MNFVNFFVNFFKYNFCLSESDDLCRTYATHKGLIKRIRFSPAPNSTYVLVLFAGMNISFTSFNQNNIVKSNKKKRKKTKKNNKYIRW